MNNRYWEQYLIRFCVPTIITSVLLYFMAYNGDFEVFHINKTNIPNINTLSAQGFIAISSISFSIVYILSSISMYLHLIRSFIYIYIFKIQEYQNTIQEKEYKQYELLSQKYSLHNREIFHMLDGFSKFFSSDIIKKFFKYLYL